MMTTPKLRRRDLLQGAAIAAVPATAATEAPRDHVYKRLGVRTLIHAQGYTTILGGSLMSDEVRQAMDEASRYFVRIEDLQRAVGRRLAEVTGGESALVTAGATASIALGTAACITGKDISLVKRLPDVEGMKHEVLIQKNHRNAFDHAVRMTGAKLIEVVTSKDYDAAFNAKTVMVMYLATDNHSGSDGPGQISFEETVAIAHRHGVPVLVDAAPELPPLANLTHFTKLGADLVCFSGGKGLQGPQCSGILTGRRDLIEVAWMNCLGTSDSIGRAMKVGKEEIVGLWAAVERFVRLDHGEQEERWKATLDRVAKHLRDLDGIEAKLLPVDLEPPHVPRLYVRWDEQARALTAKQAIKALAEGDPAIYVRYLDNFGLTVVPVGIQPGEEEIIGRRLREILGGRV